jgi:hypothetical protein
MHRQNRLRDLLLYVVIALVVLTTAVVYSVVAARTGGGNDEDVLAWIWTITTAGIVFGYLVYHKRNLIRRLSFWGFISLLIGVHFVLYLRLFQSTKVPLLWISFAIAPEFIAVGFIADRVFGEGGTKSRSKNW